MSPPARGARRARRRAKRLREPLLRRRCHRRGGLLTSSAGLRVLGVDPGSRRAGWAVLSGTAYRPVLTACGAIVLPERLSFEQRLAKLQDEMNAIVAAYQPTFAAVEAPFHGISARSALQLAHARGVILASLGRAAVPVQEYAPATIKKAVTGTGSAEKLQVQTMVARLLAVDHAFEGPDVADAAAAALCHLFGSGTSAVGSRAGRRGR